MNWIDFTAVLFDHFTMTACWIEGGWETTGQELWRESVTHEGLCCFFHVKLENWTSELVLKIREPLLRILQPVETWWWPAIITQQASNLFRALLPNIVVCFHKGMVHFQATVSDDDILLSLLNYYRLQIATCNCFSLKRSIRFVKYWVKMQHF